MAGFMKSLKCAFMSELLTKTALRVDDGDVRLTMRVRRDRVTREKYVVLGLVAAMNYKHAELSADEFQEFLAAAVSLQKALDIPDVKPPLKA
jgi:hypothetical protein